MGQGRCLHHLGNHQRKGVPRAWGEGLWRVLALCHVSLSVGLRSVLALSRVLRGIVEGACIVPRVPLHVTP